MRPMHMIIFFSSFPRDARFVVDETKVHALHTRDGAAGALNNFGQPVLPHPASFETSRASCLTIDSLRLENDFKYRSPFLILNLRY